MNFVHSMVLFILFKHQLVTKNASITLTRDQYPY